MPTETWPGLILNDRRIPWVIGVIALVLFAVANVPWQVGDILRKDYAGLFKYIIMDGGTDKHLLSYGEKKIKPKGDYTESRVIDRS